MPFEKPVYSDSVTNTHRTMPDGSQIEPALIPVDPNGQITINAAGVHFRLDEHLAERQVNFIKAIANGDIYVEPSEDAGNILVKGSDGNPYVPTPVFVLPEGAAEELLSKCDGQALIIGCDGGIYLDEDLLGGDFSLTYDPNTGTLTLNKNGQPVSTVTLTTTYIKLADTPDEYGVTTVGNDLDQFYSAPSVPVGMDDGTSPDGGRLVHTDRHKWQGVYHTLIDEDGITLKASVEGLPSTWDNNWLFNNGGTTTPIEIHNLDYPNTVAYPETGDKKREGHIVLTNRAATPTAGREIILGEGVEWSGPPLEIMAPYSSALLRYVITDGMIPEANEGTDPSDTVTRAFVEVVYPRPESGGGASTYLELTDTPDSYDAQVPGSGPNWASSDLYPRVVSNNYDGSAIGSPLGIYHVDTRYEDNSLYSTSLDSTTGFGPDEDGVLRLTLDSPTATVTGRMRRNRHVSVNAATTPTIYIGEVTSSSSSEAMRTGIVTIQNSNATTPLTIALAELGEWAYGIPATATYEVPPRDNFVFSYVTIGQQYRGITTMDRRCIITPLYIPAGTPKPEYNVNLEFGAEDAEVRFFVKEGMTRAVIEPVSVSSNVTGDLSGVSITIEATYPERDTMTTLGIDQTGVPVGNQAGKNVKAVIENWPAGADSVSMNVVFS